MASIEFIQKRIAGKEKEIATLNKKLDRIYKAQASNWEKNPYYYSEYDLKSTLKDLDTAQKAIEKYQADLVIEQEKSDSRNVQVILDFLESWKQKVYNYYSAGLEEYYAEKSELSAMSKQIYEMEYLSDRESRDYNAIKLLKEEYDVRRKQFTIDCKGEFVEIPKTDPSYRRFYNTQKKVADGKYEWLKQWNTFSTLEEALTNLEKVLTREAQLKYDDLIERCNKIVREITDASNLYVGNKGDLNGYVLGTRGAAEVQTIGAGGYNIQVFHFRTLVKPIKNPESLVTL